ncbi:MAG: amidohydrolase family protein [Planctomycetes bacterium]|nr:amidohydrolase family protein [Planctomycetota bacterium]
MSPRTTTLVLALALLTPCVRANEHPYETDVERAPALRTGGTCVIRNVTIHSAVAPPQVGDVLVLDGKIAAVGTVDAPAGIVEIDGTGKHLAPGVVDCHSHMAIERGVNEGSVAISAEVDISDSLDPTDVTIYRALAGGVTTARLLHGSANPIGGKHEVVKLKWGRTADELRFPGAPEGIKFALGENVKRPGASGRGRFPATRMGTAAVYERAFQRAEEYARDWEAYRAAVGAGEDPAPPRRDLRLETLAGILSGDVVVHCHCYRADGILMILDVARRYGFTIGTLQHVLEGYKVAFEMAQAGTGGSTFGDWWSYKVEAYDAIPQNAFLMDEAGVLSSVNSDSDEMMRRLYGEAAKSVRYAGMDRVRALGLVTLFPAQQLGIGDRVGSIEPGKDADLVLLTREPLSSLGRVEWTMVDGEVEFERRDTFGFDAAPLVAAAPTASPAAELEWDPAGGELVALRGGTLHTVSGPVIEDGTLLMQGGKLLYVGPARELPLAARVVDVTGKHVWPGLVALNTSLGLREIEAVDVTVDTREIGGNQPDLETLKAINAESAHVGVTRYNGVTRAEVAPQSGGPILGRSSVIDLDGDNWQELAMVEADMLHVDFPRVSNAEKKKEMPKEAEELRKLLRAAREYADVVEAARAAGTAPPDYDARLEALAPYARGEARIALHASNAQTILYALRFAADEHLDVVLFGASEGWKVADRIAAAGVPVAVGPVLALPNSEYDPYDAPFANAAALRRAGVEIALMSDDQENPRNLAFHAAMASAFGLPAEDAVRAITLGPAEVLGLGDRLGSLEPGKIADVVVTDGDLLEIASPVEYVFIDGVQTSLENRQTRFYEKYAARLERLKSQAPR